jgi:hypothetical protein
MKNKKYPYFAWIKFQRRIASVQSFLGYEYEYITLCFRNIYRGLNYVIKSLRILIFKNKPEVVWIQLPPVFYAVSVALL